MSVCEILCFDASQLSTKVTEIFGKTGHFHTHRRMQMAYAVQSSNELEVRYLLSCDTGQPFMEWRVPVKGALPSLAHRLPMLSWYESEMTDLFGIHFDGHPHPQPLVLHEGARSVLPPMLQEASGTPLSYMPTPAWPKMVKVQ